MDKDNLYKQHILDAIGVIESYVAGKTFDDFSKDKMMQDAVLHEVQIIGEAAKQLSKKFKEKYDAPWRKIAGTEINWSMITLGLK